MADMTKSRAVQIAPGAWTDAVQSAEFEKLIDAKRRSMVPMIINRNLGRGVGQPPHGTQSRA
jgi:hypothetical protein